MGVCLHVNIFCVGQAARGSAKNISQQKGSAAQKVWEPLLYRAYHPIQSSNTVAYRGDRGGEAPWAALPKGRHFREKWENLRKNGKIYVKNGKIFCKNGQKSRKLEAAQAKTRQRGRDNS